MRSNPSFDFKELTHLGGFGVLVSVLICIRDLWRWGERKQSLKGADLIWSKAELVGIVTDRK